VDTLPPLEPHYTFECDDPETWLAKQATAGIQHTHGVARAPGSIDAVTLMYTASKFLKEAMLPHNGGWSINEFILTAGQAAADNLAPNIGQIHYACRAPFVEMQEKVFATLDNNAEHAAAITHCTVKKEWITKTRPGLPNHALAGITYRNFERVGPPKWSEAGKAFGREIQKTLGIAPMDDPFPPEHEQLTSPQDGEAWFRANLPSWQKNFAADDYVEYTWHAPTVRLYVARPILRAPEPGYRYPEWTRFAMGGTPRHHRPDVVDGGQGHRADAGRPRRRPGPAGALQGGVPRAHRRRHRRHEMDAAAAAGEVPGARRIPLAGVCRDGARPGMVDPHHRRRARLREGPTIGRTGP
jgi:metal-dependent amidase/aminoacylase/carboxypeptidase family protein